MIVPKKAANQPELPVHREILGHFVESGFGRQVSGMWSEMIFNRAFREIKPYSFFTWEWLGFEQPMYHEGAPFWHSGYEEHDWKSVGEVSRQHTHGSNTFKGKQSLKLENLREALGGLRQDRIHVEAGKRYHFTVFAGVQGKHRMAGLDGFEGHDHTGEEKPFVIRFTKADGSVAAEQVLTLTPVQQPYTMTFTFRETGWVDLQLLMEWKGTVLLSWVSMMPEDNRKGWRADVVELMKQVQVPVVRFPGGCFVSFFDWESSIGPRDRREPMESYYWGGLEENDVGLDEFMDLAEMVGFQPQICFNMMSSYPFKARQMVEYLNAPADEGMGRLRKINGYEKPRGVRLFEMDNEPWRKWSPTQYAAACVEFGTEMRKADDGIELMMACYGYPIESLRDMLDIAGGTVNYVIYRNGAPDFVPQVLEILRQYQADTGNHVRMVNTEWLPSCGSRTPFEEEGVPNDFNWGKERITNDYRHTFGFFQIRWSYALNGAERILDYMSYGGEFRLANFNNCCNTWGQNIINASKESAWLSCAGEMFRLFGDYFVEGTAENLESGVPGLRLQILRSGEGDRFFLVNNTREEYTVQVDGGYEGECLSGPDRLARITEREHPLSRKTVSGEGSITLPAWSVTALKI